MSRWGPGSMKTDLLWKINKISDRFSKEYFMLYVQQAELHITKESSEFASQLRRQLKRFECEIQPGEQNSRYHAVRALYYKILAHVHDFRVLDAIKEERFSSQGLLDGLARMRVDLEQSRNIYNENKVDDAVVLAEVAQTWFNWYGKVLRPSVFPEVASYMAEHHWKIYSSVTSEAATELKWSKRALEEALLGMFCEADTNFESVEFGHDRASLHRNVARFYLESSSAEDANDKGLEHVKIAEEIASQYSMKPRFHEDLKNIKDNLQKRKPEHSKGAPATWTCRTWKVAVTLLSCSFLAFGVTKLLNIWDTEAARETTSSEVLKAAESIAQHYAARGLEGVRRGHALIIADASQFLRHGIGHVRGHSDFAPENNITIQSELGTDVVLRHMNMDGMTLIDKASGVVHANNVFAARLEEGSGFSVIITTCFQCSWKCGCFKDILGIG